MKNIVALLMVALVAACSAPEPVFTESAAAAVAKPVNGEIEVRVGGMFTPARFEAKAGEPLKISFLRTDEPSCGDEVIFPALNIRKKLPAKQTTIVSITPLKTGDLSFTCGMNMMQGTIVVQ